DAESGMPLVRVPLGLGVDHGGQEDQVAVWLKQGDQSILEGRDIVDGDALESEFDKLRGFRRGGVQSKTSIAEGTVAVRRRVFSVREDQRQGLLGGEHLETNRSVAHRGIRSVESLVGREGGLTHIDVKNRRTSKLRSRTLHAVVIRVFEDVSATLKLRAGKGRRGRGEALVTSASNRGERLRRSSRLRLRRGATRSGAGTGGATLGVRGPLRSGPKALTLGQGLKGAASGSERHCGCGAARSVENRRKSTEKEQKAKQKAERHLKQTKNAVKS